MNELMEQLRVDVKASVKAVLDQMTRDEMKELSFFYAEERKFIESQRKNAA